MRKQSPFQGILPRANVASLQALPKSKLQPPVSSKKQRLSLREATKSVPCAAPVPSWRTINLDAELLDLPDLDGAVWADESPFIIKASGVEYTSSFAYNRAAMDRPIYCVGDAQFYAALHLERSYGGILTERPFRLRAAGKTCTPAFLTAPGVRVNRGPAVPWRQVHLWQPISVTVLGHGEQAKRRRVQLEKEVNLCLELARRAKCRFALLLVERPGHPPATQGADYLAKLPCTVEIVTRPRRENLLLLKRHEVCLRGRDERLLDALIWHLLDRATTATVTEWAEALPASTGRITEAVLNAAFHGVLRFDLERPFDIASSAFSLSPEWQAILTMLRNPGRKDNIYEAYEGIGIQRS